MDSQHDIHNYDKKLKYMLDFLARAPFPEEDKQLIRDYDSYNLLVEGLSKARRLKLMRELTIFRRDYLDVTFRAAQAQDLQPFYLDEPTLLRHITIFGQSGSGKTNLGYILALNLLKKDVPFLVLDWKRNYRDLRAIPAGENVEVYTVGKTPRPFRFNPLIPPPGTPPTTWVKKIVEVIAHAYFVGEGVISILQRALHEIVVKFQVPLHSSHAHLITSMG